MLTEQEIVREILENSKEKIADVIARRFHHRPYAYFKGKIGEFTIMATVDAIIEAVCGGK